MTTGLSNFTSRVDQMVALEWPPEWLKWWLTWWTAPRDAPVLALLGLVAVMVGLGLLARARR